MTLTTQVRINWPVPAVALLDHVTLTAGGDPATVQRVTTSPGDGGDWPTTRHSVRNRPGQGLRTLAWVQWGESLDTGEDGWPEPPALVVLCIDNPYGFGIGPSGRTIQATTILPAIAGWLDERNVPRESWWWADETAGTFHPGSVHVCLLDDDETPRATWQPDAIASR